MVALPAYLERWRADLDLWPTDLAQALGPWLLRLSNGVGPLRHSTWEPWDEPNGYGDVARRGRYERLLLTEWGVADVEWDEFLRRAVMDEHLFLSIDYCRPSSTSTCVVLFDSGPEQVGAPRLVHLAALLVLAQRAREAGVSFLWGVMQDACHDLFDVVSRASLHPWLESRSFHAADEARLRRWHEVLKPGPDDDVWLVGGASLAQAGAFWPASRLVVEEPLSSERSLTAHIDSGERVSMVLDLPPEAECVRLLRHPFQRAHVSSVRPAPPVEGDVSNLIFRTDGVKMAMRTGPTRILLYPVPSSAGDAPGKPRRRFVGEDESLLAVGFRGRDAWALSQAEGGLRLALMSGQRRLRTGTPGQPCQPELVQALESIDDTLGRCCFSLAGEPMVWMGGRLLVRRQRDVWTLQAANALDVQEVNGGLLVVYQEADGCRVVFSQDGEGHVELGQGRYARLGSGYVPFYAVSQGGAEWQIVCSYTVGKDETRHTLSVPNPPCALLTLALVYLSDDARTVHWQGVDRAGSLPQSASVIRHVSANQTTDVIAYVTEDGHVCVYQTRGEVVKLREWRVAHS